MINVLNFETSNLKLDKKTWKNIDIYYIDITLIWLIWLESMFIFQKKMITNF